MNKQSKITLFTLAVITVVLVVVIAVSGSPNSDFSLIYKFLGTPVTAVQKAFSRASRSVRDWFGFVFSYDDVQSEMERMREENSRIALLEDRIDQLQSENEELRGLIPSLKDYSDSYNLIAANLIAEDVTDWFNYYTVDVGTLDGVDRNCPVVTEDGLVGIVVEAGLTSSKVLTVVAEQNAFMCRIVRSNQLVRVRGVSGESLQYELVIDRIAKGSSVFVGDKIVTADSGGVYPRGLRVGTVREVYVDEKSGEISAVVDPAVDLTSLSKVFIMTLQGGGDRPEDGGGS